MEQRVLAGSPLVLYASTHGNHACCLSDGAPIFALEILVFFVFAEPDESLAGGSFTDKNLAC